MATTMKDQRNRYNIITGAPNVRAAGGIQIGAPLTTTAHYPEDATAAPAPELGMNPAGHISEDGVTKTVDRSTEKIKDWNGDTVMVLDSDHSVSLKLTFLESANVDILRAIYGPENVIIKNGGKSIRIAENAEPLQNLSTLFDIKGGNNTRVRVLAPDAKITSVGDVQWVKSGVVKYEVTMECFPDADGNKLYQWLDRDNADAAAVTRTLTLPEGASGGKWSVTVDGVTVGDLAHNITADTLKPKLAEKGLTTVEVTGKKGGGPYVFTNVSLVTADTSGLSGGSGEVKIERGDTTAEKA